MPFRTVFFDTYRGLIHSQMDAGYKEDAARTCLNAVNLARKKSPSQLIEVLKLQVLIIIYWYLYLCCSFPSRCIITLVRLKRMRQYRQNGQLFVSCTKPRGNVIHTSRFACVHDG